MLSDSLIFLPPAQIGAWTPFLLWVLETSDLLDCRMTPDVDGRDVAALARP